MAIPDRHDDIAPGQPYRLDRFGYRHALAAKTESGVVELPFGTPTADWTIKQLDAFAGRKGIDVSRAKNKTERLAAIAQHSEATAPALPPE
jgi:hypothetical protein